MEHEKIVQNAFTAVRAIHEDKSVSLETTLDSLQFVEDEIHTLIEVIKEDIERQ